MIASLIAAFIVSLAATAAGGLVLIPVLRALKAGQSIKKDGPVWHESKSGTPTMGGIMFIAAILIVGFTVNLKEIKNGEFVFLFVFAFAFVFALIGFLDDFEKVKQKQNTGLTALQKFLLQLAAAIAFIMLLRRFGYLTPNLYIPFVNVTLPLPEVVYLIFAAFVIVGTVNAVNITDGVDGLVSGVTIPVALCYVCIAFTWKLTSLGLFAAALVGGLAGFLIFNFHPAKVFMGDTGSLFLGGAVCATAFALDIPLVLVPLGIIYIAETLSDIIQIAYFKATHGKRIFKMAPLHHHFEMCGWSEEKLFVVFSGISAVFAVLSYFSVMGKFGA